MPMSDNQIIPLNQPISWPIFSNIMIFNRQDEMEAWTPVLTNIALLIIASVHCLVCIISIYHVSKRVCPCFRAKQPFDHNQFDPGHKTGQYIIHVDEKKGQDPEKVRSHELCKDLEVKLQGETMKKKKVGCRLLLSLRIDPEKLLKWCFPTLHDVELHADVGPKRNLSAAFLPVHIVKGD